MSAGGRVEAVGFATIDLSWLSRFVAPSGLPSTANVVLLDSALTIVAAYPPGTGLVGRGVSVEMSRNVHPVDAVSGYADTALDTGAASVGAYATVPIGSPPKRLTVYVGLSDAAYVAQINHLFWVIVLGTLGAALAAIGLAWFAGGALVVRPARAIADAARRLAAGDVAARTGVRPSRSQLGRLAADVDVMAEELQSRTEALVEQQQRYQGLVENLPALVYESEGKLPGGSVTVLNDPGFGLGPPGARLTPASLLERVHPDDRVEVVEQIQRCLNEGVAWSIVYRLAKADGSYRWVRGTGTPIGDPAALVRQGIHFDITAEKEQQEAIRHYADRLEALTAIGQTALAARRLEDVAAAALPSIVAFCAPATASIGIWSTVGYRCLASYPAGTPPFEPSAELREQLAATGLPVAMDAESGTLVLPIGVDGSALGVVQVTAGREAMSSELREAFDEIVAQLALGMHQALLFDALREQAQLLEQRVAERTAELLAANAGLEDFATTVAHDLRTPLRAMAGFSQALLDDYAVALGPVGSDFALRIVAATALLDHLIADLLEYTRIGRADVELLSIDLDSLAEAVRSRFADAACRQDGVIEIERPLGRAIASRPLLLEALANLVDNALTFVGDSPPVVRIRVEPRGDRVRLAVDDNGIGVDPAQYDRIWTIFERLNPRHLYPGTGIGLAIVAKAAQRMGARVGVASREGGGTTFWIDLERPS